MLYLFSFGNGGNSGLSRDWWKAYCRLRHVGLCPTASVMVGFIPSHMSDSRNSDERGDRSLLRHDYDVRFESPAVSRIVVR